MADDTVSIKKTALGENGLAKLVSLILKALGEGSGGDESKGDYLPLTGGTLEGGLVIEGQLDVTEGANINGDLELGGGLNVQNDLTIHKGELTVENGRTRLHLTEKTDAPSVVVAGDEGTLYKVPKSEIGGMDMDAITDAEIDALFEE